MFYIFYLFPYHIASHLGGSLFKIIGSRLKATKVARKNLINIMLFSQEKAIQTTKNVWENLGRNAAEFIHINKMSIDKFENIITEIRGVENLQFLKGGGFLFTAHIGNWEILPRFIKQNNLDMALVYRPANNKMVDRLILQARSKYSYNIPKGQNGIKHILDYLKNKKVVGMLVDQKMNDGIEVPFFNKPAMTAPAIAKLALKFHLPIIPIRVIRQNNKSFIIEISKPLDYSNLDSYQIMVKINKIIEGWISEYPDQWFWLHNRWRD